MEYRSFFKESTFTKIADGESNWDYYLMQYKDSKPSVVAIAREGTGAIDSQFGDLNYFKRFMASEYSKGVTLTSYGENLFR